jgi:hypothetical protein
MTSNERNKIMLTVAQRRAAVRKPTPRSRGIEPPRFTREANIDYPVGYLAQLARPFTTRQPAVQAR